MSVLFGGFLYEYFASTGPVMSVMSASCLTSLCLCVSRIAFRRGMTLLSFFWIPNTLSRSSSLTRRLPSAWRCCTFLPRLTSTSSSESDDLLLIRTLINLTVSQQRLLPDTSYWSLFLSPCLPESSMSAFLPNKFISSRLSEVNPPRFWKKTCRSPVCGHHSCSSLTVNCAAVWVDKAPNRRSRKVCRRMKKVRRKVQRDHLDSEEKHDFLDVREGFWRFQMQTNISDPNNWQYSAFKSSGLISQNCMRLVGCVRGVTCWFL